MLANFAFFLGGDRRNNPLGMVGMLLVMLLAPIAAVLVQMAVSRSREFEADKAGAEISGRPLWLASALEHIDAAAKRIDNVEAEQNPATAHMFIVNPLHGGLSGLFASHPSTEERIARLRALAGQPAATARSLGVSAAAGFQGADRPRRTFFPTCCASGGRSMRRSNALAASIRAMPGLRARIASETLRRFGQLDALIRAFVPKLPPPHRAGPALEIMLAGACELLFLEVAPHAAVDGANRLAQADDKAVHFKPLINAVLRRITREGKDALARQDAARLNVPDWLWSRWMETYGEETTRAIASAHLAQATARHRLSGALRLRKQRMLFGNVWRLERCTARRRAARLRRGRILGAGRGRHAARHTARRCERQARDRSLRGAGRQDRATGRRRCRCDRGRARSATRSRG